MKPNIHKLVELCEARTGRSFSFAPAYAEPGYTDPANGIVFGNWNPTCGFSVSRDEQKRDPVSKLGRVLEHNGYELEWEDEWAICADCGNAVRIEPNCYHWTSHYRILNECELVCLECLGKDKESYLESIEDNPNTACPPAWDPTALGYMLYNVDKYETGLHEHMNDSPKKILKEMHSKGLTHVVFRVAEKSQFYITWNAYHKQTVEE